MWVVGIIGMALKTTEVAQSMLFRDTDDPDNPHGGPMFVAHRGFKKWNAGGLGWAIGALFCLTLLISAATGGNMFQAWNVGDITREAMDLPKWITGVILALIVATVIIGGIKRIGSVASVLVPFMCVLYVLIALAVLVLNLGAIPDVIGLIFSSAFSPLGGRGRLPRRLGRLRLPLGHEAGPLLQ